MPHHDPTPDPSLSARKRFWRIFRILVLLAAVLAAIGVVLVSRGDPTIHIHMMIATAIGIFLTVLIGTVLMTLAFISDSTGYDAVAANFHEEEGEDDRP